MVLIESDWNLKCTHKDGFRPVDLRINRIRLEFKAYQGFSVFRCIFCINRIRLEFKGTTAASLFLPSREY